MNKTPWPIELHAHPLGTKKKIEKSVSVFPKPRPESHNSKLSDSLSHQESEREYDMERNASDCFENPQKYRKMILENVEVPLREKFDGGSVFYMWLTKECPVRCDFCFFKSPRKAAKTHENEITDEGIDKIIQFTKDAKIEKVEISGGGEPMKAKEKLYKLISNMETRKMVLVTSCYWSKTEKRTEKLLGELRENAHKNPSEASVTIRASLDKDHFEKLSRGAGYKYLHNVINWFSENAIDDPKFNFLIHTMEGDATVEGLLSELPIKTREEKGSELSRKTEITLENGFKFRVEYSQVFNCDTKVDLTDEQKEVPNKKEFTKFIADKKNGHMACHFHKDCPSGTDFLTFYDGTVIVWGATPPDTETSIYDENYQQTMKKNLKDVIALSMLEKGTFYLQDIVNEINPKAVARAIGMGLRDFYTRILLEEDTTRLYTSVRLIQEYIQDGRITEEQIKSWPKQLQALISLEKEKLAEICKKSSHNIVSQYLEDPGISEEQLNSLYELVCLGHYPITPKEMREQIANAADLDPGIKLSFIQHSGPHRDIFKIAV